jgi:hypothetical protein
LPQSNLLLYWPKQALGSMTILWYRHCRIEARSPAAKISGCWARNQAGRSALNHDDCGAPPHGKRSFVVGEILCG